MTLSNTRADAAAAPTPAATQPPAAGGLRPTFWSWAKLNERTLRDLGDAFRSGWESKKL